ncbi:hypothetical protein PGT21_013996 [Puccinia graminis f. sp. tritici]|uniref:Uncharacterized protein n=1 Tax=Puccinia graminis f. sp. tritici TaxID=56615 RepID=A0A5B0QAE7_PUCGR|nr:hypothetical protein PGT21_013996 [Puccinia graminis f. sp. tritici]
MARRRRFLNDSPPSTFHPCDKFSSRASFRLSATTAARRDVPDSNMTKHASNVHGKYQCLVSNESIANATGFSRYVDMDNPYSSYRDIALLTGECGWKQSLSPVSRVTITVNG